MNSTSSAIAHFPPHNPAPAAALALPAANVSYLRPKGSALRPVTAVDASASDVELFQAMVGAGPADRERIQEILVLRHTGLVKWLAAQYANKAVEVEELRQVGYLGLVLAIQRYDVERGHDFTSFARPTVQGEIRRYFRDKRRWIRLPRRLQETKAAIRASSEVLVHELGRQPRVEEIAAHADLPVELVSEAIAADDTFAPLSLDAPMGSDGDESFTICDTLGENDSRLELIVNCDAVRPLIAELPDREKRMLLMRFYEDKTQSEIGAELGISQMHVSRLLSRTLDNLRGQLEAA
ncbi:MAG: SigB/SigF/SigG family RNA polymerase sigma factor [Sporichthyaceae bacterium]